MGDWYNSEPQPDRPHHHDVFRHLDWDERPEPSVDWENRYGRSDDFYRGRQTSEYHAANDKIQRNFLRDEIRNPHFADTKSEINSYFSKRDPELIGAMPGTHAMIKTLKNRGYTHAQRDLLYQSAAQKGREIRTAEQKAQDEALQARNREEHDEIVRRVRRRLNDT